MKYVGLCRKCKAAMGEKISFLARECVEMGNCENCGRRNINLHHSYVHNKWRGLAQRAAADPSPKSSRKNKSNKASRR